MKNWRLIAGGVFVLGAIIIAYFAGVRTSTAPVETSTSLEPRTLEEVSRLESQFDRQQVELTNRIADVQNKIKTAKINLDIKEDEYDFDSPEIAERLAELDGRLVQMKAEGISSDVPFPPDSPAGKLQNQPRTASGIPVSVLQKYEQETGVSPEEIEELMRRTE